MEQRCLSLGKQCWPLKRILLSLPLALADIISRRSAMLETLIWAETERGGDAGGPDLSRKYYKLSFIP